MKKRLTALSAALLLLLCILPRSASAEHFEPAIRDIDISVTLTESGTAYVQEVWDVTVASGTEWYISMGNMGNKTVANLTVQDERGVPYLDEGSWDVDRDIYEKAGRCGIVYKSDGYELCWGVGSYGDHVFTVSYTIYDFVTGFDDADGFNHEFVTYNLSSPPQHIRVTIEKEHTVLTRDDTRVWAFGFEGDVWVTDGVVVAESAAGTALRSSSYADVMCRFEKGMFSPTETRGGSFDVMQDQATGGSDYDEEETESRVRQVMFIIVSVSVIALVVFIVFLRRLSRRASYNARVFFRRGELKNAPYCRDLPFGGDLPAAYRGLEAMGRPKNEGALIGAYLLRWIQQGVISLEERPGKGLLHAAPEPSIVFPPLPAPLTGYVEKDLYDLLVSAAGDDAVLQEKEFYKWSKKNYSKVDMWFSRVSFHARDCLVGWGDMAMVPRATAFGLAKSEAESFTSSGRQHLLDMAGFERYLKDYTLLSERSAEEAALWDDYLVFATLFGMADRVEKQFRDLYPAYFERPAPGGGYGGHDVMDFYACLAFSRAISNAAARGMGDGRDTASFGGSDSSWSGGGGGSSSFSGGGGHSGGGGGGGSR